MRGLIDRLDGSIAGLFTFVSQSHLRALALIVLLASIITLPGLSTLPVTDRDEARYVQASKQMMETGDYIDIRNLENPRWKKPVGIYWLQVASAKLLADGADSKIWAYRVPSALGIILAAMLTYWALIPLLGTRAALIGGLVTASTATTAVEAHIAKTDAVLLAFTVLAFGALVRIYQDRATSFSKAHALLWAGLGLGFLIKGPIILIPFVGTLLWIAIAERSTSLLRAIAPLRGLLLFALIAAPWYIAIALKTDGAFFTESLGKDLLGKVGTASEKHGGPPGYYLMTMWITFWPWAPLILAALPLAWATRGSDNMRLLAGWIIPCWLVFALTSTKLPHYVLPTLPALAGLIALGITQTPSKAMRILAAFLFILGGIVAGVFAFGPLPMFENAYPPLLILAAVVSLLLLIFGAVAMGIAKPYAFAGLGVAALIIIFPSLSIITAPNTKTLFISPRLVAAHTQFKTCTTHPIRAVGYHEMSLAFLGGTDTRFISLDQAGEYLAGPTDGKRVFVQLGESRDTLSQLSNLAGKPLESLTLTKGRNYNSGGDVRIAQVAVKDDPALTECRGQ